MWGVGIGSQARQGPFSVVSAVCVPYESDSRRPCSRAGRNSRGPPAPAPPRRAWARSGVTRAGSSPRKPA